VAKLDKPLEVHFFFPSDNEIALSVAGYVRQLSSDRNKVSLQFHDPVARPELAKQYDVSREGTVVLVHDKQKSKLDFNLEKSKASVLDKLKGLDGNFRRKLLNVWRKRHVVYLTVGHNERNELTRDVTGRKVSLFQALLRNRDYAVENLGKNSGLATAVPADAVLVAVLGPTRPFSSEELGSLTRYWNSGGSLLLALDPEQKPKLEALAALVGLKWQPQVLLHDKVLVRRRRDDSDKAILVARDFTDHPTGTLCKKLTKRGAVVVMSQAAGLEQMQPPSNEVKIDFVVDSMGGTYRDLDDDLTFDPSTEKRGVYHLAAAVLKPLKERGPRQSVDSDKHAQSRQARAFVLGDVDVFSDAAFGNQGLLNAMIAAEAVRWLAREQPLLSDESPAAVDTSVGMASDGGVCDPYAGPKGSDQPLWPRAAQGISKIRFRTDTKEIILEERTDAQGRWFLGTVKRVSIGRRAKIGGTGDGGERSGSEKPLTPEVFVSVKNATRLVDRLAKLKRARPIGVVAPAREAVFGLDPPEGELTVWFGDQQRSVQLGSRSPISKWRYVRVPETKRIYGVSSSIFGDFLGGARRLSERRTHGWNADEAAAVIIRVGDEQRRFVRCVREGGECWANEKAPKKTFENVVNWLSKLSRLRAVRFVEALPSAATKVFRVEYSDASKTIGYLELYRHSKPASEQVEFFLVSEYLRIPAKISKRLAEQLEQDLSDVMR